MVRGKASILFAAGGLLVLLALPQVYLWSHTCDDAFITFRYLLHFGAGQGLVFNPAERVEGFSHPLFVLLLMPVALLPNPAAGLVLGAKLIGFLSTLLGGVFLFDAMRRLELSTAAVVAGMAMWLAQPGVHVYATAGLETPLLGLLLMMAFWREVAGRGPGATGLLLGLAAITRPEAALHGILWLAWRARVRGGIPWLGIALWLLPPVLWQVFRLAYYGDWLPNPFHAKPPGTFGGKLGIPYLAPFAVASLPPLLVLALFGRQRGEGWPAGWLAVLLTVPELLLVVYTRGDWMPFGRFLVPVWGLVAVVAARGLDRMDLGGWRAWAGAAGAALAVLLSFAPGIPAYLRGDDLNEIMRGTNQLAAGRWLADHVGKGDSVAAVRLGGLAYPLMGTRVLDMAGLTDREAGRHLGAHGGSIAWESHPFRSINPTWIAVVMVEGDDGPAHDDAALAADLRAHYEPATEIPQGPRQKWVIHRRRTP